MDRLLLARWIKLIPLQIKSYVHTTTKILKELYRFVHFTVFVINIQNSNFCCNINGVLPDANHKQTQTNLY